MFHGFNAADADLCLSWARSEPAFLDQIAELELELLDILGRRTVACRVRIQAGAARLIEHPDAGFAIAEGDLATDERAGQGEAVHGGRDLARRDRRRLFLLLFHDFRLFDQLDAEVEDEKTGVHVGEGVSEIVFQMALEVGHGGSLGGPLLERVFLFRGEFAGAEHAFFVNDARRLPSPKTPPCHSFRSCH